jgi:uncharacterized membrane protein YuzA (DUF378 family)
MSSKCGCAVVKIAKILLIIGGLNWALVGVGMFAGVGMGWNIVHMILGSWSWLEAIVYILVGVAALVKWFGCPCPMCKSCTVGAPAMGADSAKM